jgi:4-amino-4-deoxy-L-arabinose transferase-like glycosyltransferase
MPDRLKCFFNPPTQGVTAPWRIFWVALVLRLAYITLAHTYHQRPYGDHFEFGYEAGRIARSLVQGTGYSDPFANTVAPHTGPTAWLPPLYPLLLAAVFKLFGIYTALSAWIILAINSVFSAFTAMSIWEIGFRFSGRRNALWSAWLWAIYPAAAQYAVRWIWEMSLSTCLLAWVIVLAFRMREGPTHQTRRWLLFGLLWGLIALSNSSLLLFLPVSGLWILIPTWPHRHALRDAILAAIVCAACIAPWIVRNQRVFRTFIPMRGNFGAELYLANGPGANGLLMTFDHPFIAADQAILYARMGEVRYVAMRGALAKAAIRANPRHFIADNLWRVYFFWCGVPHDSGSSFLTAFLRLLDYSFISFAGLLGLALALARRKLAAGLFLGAILLIPLPYYLVTAHARFRHPLEPLLCVLGVYLFQSAERKTPRRS